MPSTDNFQSLPTNKIRIIQNLSIRIYLYYSSMKSKRIVYFDEKVEDKTTTRRQSASKNNLSISKGIRETSNNKHQRTPSARVSGMDKNGSSQKIRILITKDGFIFEKKYMIYDIQCTLTRQTVVDKPKPEGQEDSFLQRGEEDFLFLNLETSSFAVTKGMVRHNFTIDRDNSNYIQVRVPGYVVDNIIISNKKLQHVLLEGTENFDQHDITIIEPIKRIEESQSTREEKIRNYYQRAISGTQTRKTSKSLNLCWPNQQSIDNAESGYKICRKNESQFMTTLNTQSITNFFQMTKQTSQRELSKARRISGSMADENRIPNQSIQKATLNELMKGTKEMTKPKPNTSRKFLNDSGLSYRTLGKIQNKQNGKKEDAYGLEEMNKRSRMKTVQNEEGSRSGRTTETDFKTIDSDLNRYGVGKKFN